MIVDLTTLDDRQRSFDLVLKPDELDLENDSVKLDGDISAAGTIRKGIAETQTQGKIIAAALIECSRCLTEVGYSLHIPFNVSFVNAENLTDQNERELSTDDLDVAVLEDDRIDLKELVREQILLGLPAQVFCREDCKGLCRLCGGDKNLINCKCDEKETDPRWSALKNLKF